MKKTVFLILFNLIALLGYSQIEVKWGERFYDIIEECEDAQIVMEDYDGYYMWYQLNEYVGKGEFELKYYMAKIDRNHTVQKVYRMDFGHPSFKIEQTWQAGELIGFVLSRVAQDKTTDKRGNKRKQLGPEITTGKANLYVQYFHTRDMRLIGDRPQRFKNYNYFSIEGQKPYLFSLSENKSKLIFGFFVNDTAGKALNMEIYDEKMRLIWERTHRLNISNDAYLIKDIAVSNDGARALIAINSFSTAKKKNHEDGKVHLIWMNEYSERLHEEKLEKAWPTSFKCAFAHEEDYLVAGYYSNTTLTPSLAVGAFSFVYDNRRGFKKNESTIEFKEYERDEDVYKGMALPSEMVAEVDYLFPMVGGNCIMIGEQRFASKVQPPKRRGDKPTGEDANFFRDIIITNVDKRGDITNSSYVTKRQKTYKEDDSYNSYSMSKDRYGVYLMFNDHQSNYKGNQFAPTMNYNSDKLRTQVNFVQIYNDGSWLWHEVYNSRINKMPFFKTMFLDRDKRIIFLGHYNDNNVIGSFETRY